MGTAGPRQELVFMLGKHRREAGQDWTKRGDGRDGQILTNGKVLEVGVVLQVGAVGTSPPMCLQFSQHTLRHSHPSGLHVETAIILPAGGAVLPHS